MYVKTPFLLSIAGLLLAACQPSAPQSTETASLPVESPPSAPAQAPVTAEPSTIKAVEGYYVGDFKAEKTSGTSVPMMTNRITISIDSLKDVALFGHSVVAGNIRPFTGTYELNNGRYDVQVKEPGDDRYDGKFNFIIDVRNGWLQGKWVANDKKLAVTERSYRLNNATFQYDPVLSIEGIYAGVVNSDKNGQMEFITEDAGKVNASTALLTKKDVENMFKRDLEVMRNAIYARHGYSFKNREMRDFFDKNVDWYIPVSTDVTKELTELEKQNIALIKRYEKHAESYYDSFGR